MTRRASISPTSWKQNLLVAAAMGAAAVLLGCGGGGGGGNNGGGGRAGDCGSPSGSGTVVCGFVTQFGTGSGVNNATVRIRTVSGSTLATGTTANDVSSGSAGFYKISVPSGTAPALISVDAPSTGYYQGYLQYQAKTYDASRNANSGGPCVPAISVVSGQDNRLLDKLVLFTDSGAPPPPVFTCPRP